MERKETDYTQIIPTALRHAALGKLVEEYLSALPPERLQAEAHTQAEEALAEIYARSWTTHRACRRLRPL